MIIGQRIQAMREEKKLTQAEVEKRTGLMCCYISRVENGYTTPSLETLEKFALALQVPLYMFFYEGDRPPAMANASLKRAQFSESTWGRVGEEVRLFRQLRRCLSHMDWDERTLLLRIAREMAKSKARKSGRHTRGKQSGT